MTLSAVLVIGSGRHTQLGEALFEAGLTPVFRESILAAIAALRKEPFLAVVVDYERADVDVLELVLNIRDLDTRLRIFVLSEERVELDGLRDEPLLTVVNREQLVHKLTPTVVPLPGRQRETNEAGAMQ